MSRPKARRTRLLAALTRAPIAAFEIAAVIVGLLIATCGCAERSRLARCACVIVLMACVGDLIVGWLHPPHAVPVLAAYTVLAVAVEWRRRPGDEAR